MHDLLTRAWMPEERPGVPIAALIEPQFRLFGGINRRRGRFRRVHQFREHIIEQFDGLRDWQFIARELRNQRRCQMSSDEAIVGLVWH
jgi:hypothetical protein